jgi:RNA polymerase sigma-70 factor (ECF subfamily)
MAIASKDVRPLTGGAAGAARGDACLVAALRDGSDGAFALLVADYQTAVHNLAWRLVRDREDARDIAQEVFLRAFQQIPRTSGDLRLWAWLYRVTVNTCWDHLRAGRRRPILAEEPLQEGDHQAADGVDQADLARMFVASLAQLPPRQQAALLLKDVHGLRHGDIAAALGISRGSSEVLLFRARRSFRSAFTAMTADVQRGPACHFAEQVAAYSVGGRLTEARSRRVLEHAVTCPDCHRTVERWNGMRAVGLGLALPLIAAPEILGAPAAAAAASTIVTVGASSALGGLTAKFAGIGVAKAAVVALAATAVVTYGGATVHKDYVKEGGVRMAIAPAVAAVASPGPAATGAVAGAFPGSDRAQAAGDRRRRDPRGARQSRALRAAPALRLARASGQPGRRLAFGFVARRSYSGWARRVTRVVTSSQVARGAAAKPARVGLALGRQAMKAARRTMQPQQAVTRPARAQARSILLSTPGASRSSSTARKARGAVRQRGAPARVVQRQD